MKKIFNWFLKENSRDMVRIFIIPLVLLFMIYYRWGLNNTEIFNSIFLSFVIITFVFFLIMFVKLNIFLVSRMKYYFDIIIIIIGAWIFCLFINSKDIILSFMFILLFFCLAIIIGIIIKQIPLSHIESTVIKIRRHIFLDDDIIFSLLIILGLTIMFTFYIYTIIFFILLFFYFIILFMYCYIISEKNIDMPVNISFLNFKCIEIIRDKVYICESTLENLNDVRIFKIDIRNLFPENSENHSVAITNYNYIDKYAKDNAIEKKSSNKSDKFVYFALDKKRINDKVRIRFFITYTLKDKEETSSTTKVNENRIQDNSNNDDLDEKINAITKKEVFDLYVKVKLIDDELCITHQEIVNHHKAFLKNTYNHAFDINDYPLEKLFYRSYMYNYDLSLDNEYNLLSSDNITDKRKWLLHEGDFGCGKTTLDILTVLNAGCIPVVISPWEENYDIDILALIFKRVAQASKKKFYRLDSSTVLFFLAASAGFFYFIQKILLYLVDKLPTQIFDNLYTIIYSNLDTLIDATSCEVFLDMLIEIVSLGIAILLALHLLPRVIIYMKDLTKVHQDYYIKNIVKMLQKDNIIMIIEDVDRLNEKVAENVFRTLSAINRQCIMHPKIIGIMSFHINSEKENNKITPTNTLLEDLENKVIYRNILDSYNSEESKKEYFKSLFHLIITLFLEECKEKNLVDDIEIEIEKLIEAVDSLGFQNMNFRDVRDKLEVFVEDLRKYYLTQSDVIYHSENMLEKLGLQEMDDVVNA